MLWGLFADKTVMYTDLGISKGMQYSIEAANKALRPIEYRKLHYTLMKMLGQTKFDERAW